MTLPECFTVDVLDLFWDNSEVFLLNYLVVKNISGAPGKVLYIFETEF